MKVRDSGMPEESLWSTFFNVEVILKRMQINKSVGNLLEVGCGYGTFTLGAAQKIAGKVFAFDIEPDMIDYTRKKANNEGLTNIGFYNRDILSDGSGIDDGTIDYVMLFNILHHDKPLELLSVAYNVLRPQGRLGIIHWRTDMETPRGPEMSIRPKPEQCIDWAKQTGFRVIQSPEILEPYHYGLIVEKQ